MGSKHDIDARGLPLTTPLGPKSMSNPPSGPRTPTRTLTGPSRPHLSRHSSTRDYNHREEYHTKLPTVAITRIPGIDKPVPTGPKEMLKELPPAAFVEGVPTAPAKMREQMKESNGSDDGRGRPLILRSVSQYSRFHSHSQSQRRSWIGDSRSDSKSRDGSATPISIVTEIEFTLPKTEDIPSVTEEKEAILEEVLVTVEAEAVQVEENSVVEEILSEEIEAPVIVEQESFKADDEEPVTAKVEEESQPAVVELISDDTAPLKVGPEVEADVPEQQPVVTEIVPEEVTITSIPAVEKADGLIAPVIISLPSIQIEADDSSRKEVDLDKDLDVEMKFPEFSPSGRAAATSSPRLSELSMKKREGEDTIVSMKVEGGVVIVPRDIPSLELRQMAKKKKVKDEEKEEVVVAEPEQETVVVLETIRP